MTNSEIKFFAPTTKKEAARAEGLQMNQLQENLRQAEAKVLELSLAWRKHWDVDSGQELDLCDAVDAYSQALDALKTEYCDVCGLAEATTEDCIQHNPVSH